MIKVIRELPTNDAIFSYLFFDGYFQCYSLENASKVIPIGIYDFELYNSPKNKRIVPLLKDVPNRGMIEIHPANYPHELEGCIAVGESQSKERNMVLSSVIAFQKLMSLIRQMDKSKYQIEIIQI